uniref:Uncharacterized protein n=1 Tax=Brassica oleracea var. oleracea TaxID=109376 RepID=A0A0D3B642_BRAOL
MPSCLAMVPVHLLPVHRLPMQFQTLRLLREFFRVLIFHRRCLHLLLQRLHLSLSQKVQFIRICVCLHMLHSRDIQWRICLPSLDGRVWIRYQTNHLCEYSSADLG